MLWHKWQAHFQRKAKKARLGGVLLDLDFTDFDTRVYFIKEKQT